jgi:serine/threonine protein kinase
MPRDKDKGPVPVMVSLKTSHLNFEAESAFYELVKQQLKPNDKILECIRLAPEYLVLEHFGEDLRSYYQADLAVRTGPLLEKILSALHALHHGLGYVHGDLQPASIRIFDVRGQFFCKLCHFHNACKAGEPFPTVGGNLILTDAWTCPELVRARFPKEAIDGTFQMDIFSLGMIVDLLCRPSQDLDTSSVIQFDKNLFLPEGTDLPLSEKEREALFFRSISCLRNDHWLRDLLRTMLSFDPWQRGGDVQIYRDALQKKSASSLYQELCLRERISIRNEEKLEAQVGDMSRVLNNFSEVIEDRFAEMRNLMKSDLLTFTQSSSDEIKRQVESIVTRLTAVNETMGKSFFGNLEATISGQMNLVSIEMVKKLDESSSGLGEQLTRMEKGIKEENDQLKGLSEDIKLLSLKGDTLAERVNSFADLALESFGGLTALVESAASTAELQTFCEQFTKNFQSTASGMIQEVGKLVGENEQIPQILTRLEEIGRRQQEDKGQLQADQSEVKSLVEELSKVMASQAVTANQNMEQVYDSIQDILQRLVLPSVTDPSSLGTALDARMDSIEALITAAATARGGAQNQDLLPEFRELATKFQLHDTEMKQMIAEVVDEIESIRNFQDLSVLEAQHYPFLFIIWEERLKESFQGLFGKAVNGIRESLYRHYRVHFCCNVCGKVAQSGSKARKMDRGWIQGACDRMSLVDPEQGGYPLTVMRRSVVKFLKYARIVLSALELGAMVAGVSVAKLVSTVSNQLNIADDMKRLADSIHDEKWIPKTIRNPVENALRLEDEGDGKRDRVMTSRDAMDAGGSDNKEKLQAVKEKGVEGRQTTRAELEAVWKSQRPHVTLEHAKMAKELLHLLKDPTGDDTGLERCSLSDGTCAWVCPEDPSDPQSCFKRFQSEGYDCCLAGLEHFLTKKAK